MVFNGLHQHDHFNFILRWNGSQKIIYNGNSVKNLLAMCPSGCGSTCPSFPVFSKGAPPAPCTNDDIIVLREAQKIAREWQEHVQSAPSYVLLHSFLLVVILLLVLLLIIRGHYRVRDLWFLTSDRQWELENDPTWGLPGKVWGLLQFRVVKSKIKDSEPAQPTDRKYSSYTDNPTTLGDRFWYYKQVLRDMYKTHKYYKRNRYFHKLAWQFIKLGKLVPETLRRYTCSKRRAGGLEEEHSNASSAEIDPQENLPWEIDLADEVNAEELRKAKVRLLQEIEREKMAGNFVNGRFHHPHHHTHHHHHHLPAQTPLTKDEVEETSKQMQVDPNADCVNVDGEMRRHPNAPKEHIRHHRHRSRQGKSTVFRQKSNKQR